MTKEIDVVLYRLRTMDACETAKAYARKFKTWRAMVKGVPPASLFVGETTLSYRKRVLRQWLIWLDNEIQLDAKNRAGLPLSSLRKWALTKKVSDYMTKF